MKTQAHRVLTEATEGAEAGSPIHARSISELGEVA
jgi:hypothetical protein